VLVFPAVFFPNEPKLEGTLYAFVIFAFAFLARPIGTTIFMAIQKHYGREVKLTLALFMLGFSTAGIALLPTSEHIGVWAIILLSLL
ncbi:MFS transporter, partial [Acinetobacter baumannii]